MKDLQNQTKQEQILDALQALLENKNIQNISVSEIAQTAGIGKGSIYYYFPSKDSIVDALVELLRSIGFNGTNMFCSSVDGYGVAEGEDIYETLKNLFRQYDIYVVFVLSEHYYASAACLNEMGAAWVLQSNYSTILTKGFRPRDIHGAINPNKKAIVIDDARHVRSALNDFKERVMGIFELEDKDDIIVWEDNRNKFLEKVGKE